MNYAQPSRGPKDASETLERVQLSPLQRVLWASQAMHPDAAVQNMAIVAHIDGTLDPKRFTAAFANVVGMSDALRTLIRNDQAFVGSEPPSTTEVVNMDRAQVATWVERRAARPLDMAQSGYDSVLILCPDGMASWFLNIHHTLTDASSSALVMQKTAEAYFDQATDAAESYFSWVEEVSDSARDTLTLRTAQKWRNRQTAARPDTFYERSAAPTPRASQIEIDLPTPLRERVENRSAGPLNIPLGGLSLTSLLVTSMALFVHRVSGSDRFSIGLPVSHRSTPPTRNLIGALVEVFPVDIEIKNNDTHQSLHQRVSNAVLNTLKAAVPGTAPAPDFAAIVNVLNPSTAPTQFGEMDASVQWLHSGAIDPSQALRLHATYYADAQGQLSEHVRLRLDVNQAVADSAHHGRIAAHLQTLLRAILDEPEQLIGAYALCTDEDLERLSAWEQTRDLDAVPDLMPLRLRDALKGNPDEVARQGDQSVSGDALWNWAQAIAQDLRAEHDTGARIGIELEPSIQAVAAIYGVVLAGMSFVPLDPSQPQSRRDLMARKAGLARRIARAQDVDTSQDAAVVDLDLDQIKGPDEAYVIFTSGSTGEPKGVPITQSGLARYVQFAQSSYFANIEKPVAALFGSLAFDLTLTTVFAPILAGGRLVAISGTGAEAMTTLAATPEVTWCKGTPSHFKLLARMMPETHNLSTIVVGGEAFAMDVARDLRTTLPELAIYNEYGPTEAVVGCMIHELGKSLDGAEVPIGRPAPGVELRVVDAYDQRIPVGVTGFLLISHPGVTQGYIGATDEPDPFVVLDGKRFYRSGDLARLRDDLVLEYLGRADDQLKVGGVRLDPTEIEQVLKAHPQIANVVAGEWKPARVQASSHCTRCGLPDDVPGIAFDDKGVCQTCHDFDRIAPVVHSWFKSESDLVTKRDAARSRRTGDYDCMHLLSGGKDSTYALYRLVDLGFKPYALTLDNGFISEQAKDNIRRAVDELGVDHEFAAADAMNEIFRDSLKTFSNVCNGCFKTIYTLATNRALELGIPLIVTGLSRGQLFETRLIPQQFEEGQFDPDIIDRAVLNARRSYHRMEDAAKRLLDTAAFEGDQVFDTVEYLDFYRYVDVDLSSMLAYLAERTPWLRPEDTGRSTNCLINAAGIHSHLVEQGYHNYAVPYAWDVRLGHKTRDEAIAELDDNLDLVEVSEMLRQVGYDPAPKAVLTAWIQLIDGAQEAPSSAELSAFMAQSLPRYAIPAAFVVTPDIPLTSNGKIDFAVLPAPQRTHRQSLEPVILPSSETEQRIVTLWEQQLRVEPIGVGDSFFALGGDSLGALEMIFRLSAEFGVRIPDELAFSHETPEALAVAIDEFVKQSHTSVEQTELKEIPRLLADTPPPLSSGEETLLFDQRNRPDELMYNVARVFHVHGAIDLPRFAAALHEVVPLHQPLSWTYGVPRHRLGPGEALDLRTPEVACAPDDVADAISTFQAEPFDLNTGPLLRCLVQKVTNGETVVTFAIHHVSGDHESFDRLWSQIVHVMSGHAPAALPTDYASFCAWQCDQDIEARRAFWLEAGQPDAPARLTSARPMPSEADGFLTCQSDLTPSELRSSRQTPVSLVLGATVAALSPFVDGDEQEIGLVASTRDHPDAEQLFGYLLNPLPLRLSMSADATFSDVAQDASLAVGKALPHRAYPLGKILTDRRLAGLDATAPSILVAFDDAIPTKIEGVPVTQRVAFNGYAVTDLSIFLEVREERVDIGLEYSGKTIGKRLAQDILSHLDEALQLAVRNPETPLSTLTPPHSVGSLLVGEDLTKGPLILERVLSHVTRVPQSIAIRCGRAEMSWSELGEHSARIGQRLIKAGLRAGDRVIVHKARAPQMIAAMLGVLRAGGTYVPVDVAYPLSRVQTILEGSGARFAILDDGQSLEGITCIDPTSDADADVAATGTEAEVAGDDIAYLMFTSGSTGTPRGVPITHRQLSDSTNARAQVYSAAPGRFAMVSSISFDSSIVGLFWTLAEGGTVLLPTEAEVHDVDALCKLVSQSSHVLCVPTLYHALLQRRAPDSPWPTQVIVAGEACPKPVADAHFEAVPTTSLTNEYGPTEATVWASAHHVKPGEQLVSAGHPVPGGWVAIVDEVGAVRPQGVPGELIIGGPNVAVGYDNDAQASSERFRAAADLPGLSNLPGTRIFRTGDRALIENGRVTYLGRLDNQLNLGGARVEPGDVENALLATGLIDAVIVTVADLRRSEDLMSSLPPDVISTAIREAGVAEDPAEALDRLLRQHGEPDLRLVAHIATKENVDVARLRAMASAALPVHMRPSVYAFHPDLPRTANGKLDRAAAARLNLPQAVAAPEPSDRADQTTVDRVVALFREELLDPDVAAGDSFFDRGGNSMAAIRLLLKIEDDFGLRLPTSALYDAPTAEKLAKHLAPSEASTDAAPLFVIPCDVGYTAPPPEFHLALSAHRPAVYLEHPNMRPGQKVIWTVSELATVYVSEIEKRWPEGPILLSAFCISVLVATEVARQLKDKGRTIAHLALLDPSISRHQVSEFRQSMGQSGVPQDLSVAGRVFNFASKAINSRLLLGPGYMARDRKRTKALFAFGYYVMMRYFRRFNGAPEHLSLDYWARGLMQASCAFDEPVVYDGPVDIVGSEEHRGKMESYDDFLSAILPEKRLGYVELSHWEIGHSKATAEYVSACFEAALSGGPHPLEQGYGLKE